MKFLVMIHGSRQPDYSRRLESDATIVTALLDDASLTKCVAVRDGRTLTTDGPFVESHEQLSGFVLVECESIECAIEHASRLPEAACGLVEVRPILELRGVVSD